MGGELAALRRVFRKAAEAGLVDWGKAEAACRSSLLSFWAQRPRKVHENGKIGTARSEEIEYSMEKSRPSYCLIRSVRVERIIGSCLPLWERR